ncbi:MAG TPA: glutathione peroxidase [Polyangiaceae bacterium]|nr:glutathione peroxidase [Polyangiaceae bacterium]
MKSPSVAVLLGSLLVTWLPGCDRSKPEASVAPAPAAAPSAVLSPAVSSSAAQTNVSPYTLQVKTLEGAALPLEQFRGSVTLFVNVASECGYTPQYAGLQRIYEKYRARGFSVLGFPSNDFGRQEPGSPAEIRAFCSSKYRVNFPMFAKVSTRSGPDQSPVYASLSAATGQLPSWNFGKYLVGRDGKVLHFYDSKVEPESAELTAAIEGALAAAR